MVTAVHVSGFRSAWN